MSIGSRSSFPAYVHAKFCCASQRNAFVSLFSWLSRNLAINVFLRFSSIPRLTSFVSSIKMDYFSYCGGTMIGISIPSSSSTSSRFLLVDMSFFLTFFVSDSALLGFSLGNIFIFFVTNEIDLTTKVHILI